MWIVRFALRRPYSIFALVVLIFGMAYFAIKSMPVDVLPSFDIPVVGILWSYPGLSAEEMEKRIVIQTERTISLGVDSIERIESTSTTGVGLLRIYLQPGADVSVAMSQMASGVAALMKIFPPGSSLPIIRPLNASSVPVGQLSMSSMTMSEAEIVDFSNNFLRPKIFSLPGISVPLTYGGAFRGININVDPEKLSSFGLSPFDISNSIQTMNLIVPSGSIRLGDMDYAVAMNSSPSSIDQFSQIPIYTKNGAFLLLGDVSKIVDGPFSQTNVVRINGRRSAYLNILKKSSSSAIAAINSIKEILPLLKEFIPSNLNITLDFDQSKFVRGSIKSIIVEAAVSSILVSLMILLFLRSWRSVVIVCTSIPLAIALALIGLKICGHSINIMTLGGLSLAIGMLVDDATVEIENIHRNRSMGMPLTVAILRGAEQVALPAIIATFSICIVFSPVLLLTGPARFMFVPTALAVVFSMTASYFLSRTLVPLMCRLLLLNEKIEASHDDSDGGVFFRFLQLGYVRWMSIIMQHRTYMIVGFFLFIGLSGFLTAIVGTDFFPSSDAGLVKIHFRAPAGTRIEETEKLIDQAERKIREIIPEKELGTVNSMLGVPPFANPLLVATDNVTGMDAEILVSLKEGHLPSSVYIKKIRSEFKSLFLGSSISFMPADIVSQVLNFGANNAIDVQIDGSDFNKSFEYAQRLLEKMSVIPGLVDTGIKQILNYPTLKLNVDRLKAIALGLNQRDVASSVLISLNSSSSIAPSFYLNPVNSVSYLVSVAVPVSKIKTVEDIMFLPMASPTKLPDLFGPPGVRPGSQALRDIASISTGTSMGLINHVNIQRVLNLTAGVEDRDLGSVVKDVREAVSSLGKLASGTKISIRGQSQAMDESFEKMGYGLILSTILVYLLMLVLYQSFIDPLIVMSAVPAAVVGVLWILVFTQTTINVQSLMGLIMAIGISTSNSILMVSFANSWRVEHGGSAVDAAMAAAKTRLRPVLMTALAMMIGMMPAALGWGEGGEQMAPLGRAVVGGLLVATAATLLIVPIFYSIFRKNPPQSHLYDERLAQEETGV